MNVQGMLIDAPGSRIRQLISQLASKSITQCYPFNTVLGLSLLLLEMGAVWTKGGHIREKLRNKVLFES